MKFLDTGMQDQTQFAMAYSFSLVDIFQDAVNSTQDSWCSFFPTPSIFEPIHLARIHVLHRYILPPCQDSLINFFPMIPVVALQEDNYLEVWLDLPSMGDQSRIFHPASCKMIQIVPSSFFHLWSWSLGGNCIQVLELRGSRNHRIFPN